MSVFACACGAASAVLFNVLPGTVWAVLTASLLMSVCGVCLCVAAARAPINVVPREFRKEDR